MNINHCHSCPSDVTPSEVADTPRAPRSRSGRARVQPDPFLNIEGEVESAPF